MERASSFEDLRRLALCLDKLDGRGVRRVSGRLGRLALPLLLRVLSQGHPQRSELARSALLELSAAQPELRQRVVRALRALATHPGDPVKAVALALLSELDASPASASFDDPDAVQRRSAAALAEQLTSDADVAAAADLMIKRLPPDEMISLLEVMAEIAPAQAARVVTELVGRVDLEGSVRSDVRRIAAAARMQTVEPSLAARSPRRDGPVAETTILSDGRGSQVVVALRRRGAQRRWRRLAILVGPDGVLEDCLYEEDVPAAELGDPRSSSLILGLIGEGYEVISEDPQRGQALAAAAARRAVGIPQRLTSSYYLGRDILDLADLHLGPRDLFGEVATAIGRAVDLFASGDHTRAKELATLCARVAPDNADVASTLGLCHLADNELPAAAQWLSRAAAAEPSWPLHHWNLASVHHRADASAACAEALSAFVAATERCSVVRDDPAYSARLALARRYVAAHRPVEPSVALPRRPRRLLRERHEPGARGGDPDGLAGGPGARRHQE